MQATLEDRLISPYRAIRAVSGGTDAPWTGVLVRAVSGEAFLLVGAERLPAGWRGWRADPSGHLLGPQDVLRREGGHDVLLPVLSGSARDFLDRRRSPGVPLALGEGVTVAVSVLRGLRELGDDARGTRGEWWLTDAGRPVLVTDRGEGSAHDDSADLLEQLTDVVGTAVAEELREAVARPRLSGAVMAHLEDALFALAQPVALADTPFAPRAARSLAVAVETDHESGWRIERGDRPQDQQDEQRPDQRPDQRLWFEHLARHVDADLADLVSRATTGVWRRVRAPRRALRTRSHRRPWILASVIAGGVMAAGLLWPGGGPATAEGSAPTPTPGIPSSAAPTPSGSNVPTGAVQPAAPDSEDLAAIASVLLTERSDCATDTACLEMLLVDASAPLPVGAIDLPAAERTVSLVDEFGAVAVVRVAPIGVDGDAQLVVIQTDGDRWMLRDVYDAQS